jgi:hypothetical protein
MYLPVLLILVTALLGTLMAFETDNLVQQPPDRPTLPQRLQKYYELIFPNHLHKVFAANSTLNEAVRQVEAHLGSDIGDIRLGCATYEVGASTGEICIFQHTTYL